MGFFDSIKAKLNSIVVGTAAGEWAATAMAVMVFADGEVEAAEVEKAKVVATTNPVVKNSIGSERGAALFADTVQAIETAPAAMVQMSWPVRSAARTTRTSPSPASSPSPPPTATSSAPNTSCCCASRPCSAPRSTSRAPGPEQPRPPA